MNTVTSLLVTSAASSMPSNMRSFTTSPPTLQSLGTAVPMPTGTVTCIDGSVVMMAKDCLNGVSGATVNTLDITIINEPMAADLAAATGANSLAGCLLSNAKADVSSIVGNPQLAIAAGLTSASGNILPTVATGDILPTATAILSNAPNSILSSIAKHIPNAGESMLNQLMNGAPTNLPASPQPPALGIAKGRRRG
jgi:hypothetical protein